MHLHHGYTNTSVREGAAVTKRYREPGADERLRREAAALQALAGHLPAPVLLAVDAEQKVIQTAFVAGCHGQEMVDAGHAPDVLLLCGKLLRELQSLPPQLLDAAPGAGSVLVHGDFGPQNMLVAPERWEVAALLDWEWVHVGQPVEDLAWAEWIVRMHHPAAVPALAALFDGYGDRPAWAQRHAAMMEKCRQLLLLAQQQEAALVALWQRRLELTEQFSDA